MSKPVVDYMSGLSKDPEAADRFFEDPGAAIEAAGLEGTTSGDWQTAAKQVEDGELHDRMSAETDLLADKDPDTPIMDLASAGPSTAAPPGSAGTGDEYTEPPMDRTEPAEPTPQADAAFEYADSPEQQHEYDRMAPDAPDGYDDTPQQSSMGEWEPGRSGPDEPDSPDWGGDGGIDSVGDGIDVGAVDIDSDSDIDGDVSDANVSDGDGGAGSADPGGFMGTGLSEEEYWDTMENETMGRGAPGLDEEGTDPDTPLAGDHYSETEDDDLPAYRNDYDYDSDVDEADASDATSANDTDSTTTTTGGAGEAEAAGEMQGGAKPADGAYQQPDLGDGEYVSDESDIRLESDGTVVREGGGVLDGMGPTSTAYMAEPASEEDGVDPWETETVDPMSGSAARSLEMSEPAAVEPEMQASTTGSDMEFRDPAASTSAEAEPMEATWDADSGGDDETALDAEPMEMMSPGVDGTVDPTLPDADHGLYDGTGSLGVTDDIDLETAQLEAQLDNPIADDMSMDV